MNSVDWKNASPALKNLWRIVSTKIAYTTITPLYFMGTFAGSEFITYNANKIYIALNLIMDSVFGGAGAYANITLYDEVNALKMVLGFGSLSYDPVAPAFHALSNSYRHENIWFSRLVPGGTANFIFNGYRLNV